MRILLRSARKLELVRKVQEREQEGWECVAPINERKEYRKRYDNGKYVGTDEYSIYYVEMERVAK